MPDSTAAPACEVVAGATGAGPRSMRPWKSFIATMSMSTDGGAAEAVLVATPPVAIANAANVTNATARLATMLSLSGMTPGT